MEIIFIIKSSGAIIAIGGTLIIAKVLQVFKYIKQNEKSSTNYKSRNFSFPRKFNAHRSNE